MSFAVARLALLASLAFAAAPARAASPEALATRHLLSEQARARNELRALLKGRTGEVLAAVRSAELTLASGGSAGAAANTLFGALQAFQLDVKEGVETAAEAQALAATDALANLGTGLAGVYPEAFYPVGRSASALFRKSIEGDVARAQAKIAKRLVKLGARFEAAGTSFAFVLRPPRGFPDWTWSEVENAAPASFAGTLDLAFLWGDLASAGGVSLRIAGTSSAGLVTVTGASASGSGLNFTVGPIPTADQRFTLVSDTLDEGLWRIATTAAETPQLVIGIR